MKSIIPYIFILILANTSLIWANQNWMESIDQMIGNGQYQRAINTLNLLQDKHKPTSRDYIIIQIFKANALKSLGRFRQAKEILLPYEDKIENYSAMIAVRFYNTLGVLYAYFSEMKKASQSFEHALAFAKQSGYVQLYCETLNEIGLLYSAHLDKALYYQSAIDAFKQAIQSVNQLSDNCLHAQLIINLAKLYVKKNDKKECIQSLKNARHYISKLPDTFRKGCLLLELASLYDIMAKNNNNKRAIWIHRAHQTYTDVEKLNLKINDIRLASTLYYQMGGLYESTNQFHDAITLSQKSIFYAQQMKDSYALYQVYWQMGRLYRKTGNIQKAIQFYKMAIEKLAPIRQQMYQSDLTKQNVFNQNIKPVYLELSEIYFNLAASENEHSKKYQQMIKASWATMDDVKSAELENIFDDPCVAYPDDQTLNLDSNLGSVAVIYFIPFPEQPVLIMRLPGGFKHLRLDIDTEVFNKMIYRLRKEIPDWGIFEEDAAKLYELIISPIYNVLKKQEVKTLVVASDGAMRLLPFSIFFSPDEKFLIEEFEIVTIPALHLTRLGETNRESPNGLFCGITKAHKIGNLIFGALPRISKELETITGIVPGDVFKDEDFTESNLTSKISKKKYSIVHLATHGEFGSIPEKTFLVTHNRPLTMDSLKNLIKQTRSQVIDFLTLSACQTAIGDERAAFGLAGGAVKAGARCAIATLWSVDDYASQKIISEFYRNVYQKKYSKAKAMQKAQLTLIEKIQFWHPALWSAFLVIGNWY